MEIFKPTLLAMAAVAVLAVRRGGWQRAVSWALVPGLLFLTIRIGLRALGSLGMAFTPFAMGARPGPPALVFTACTVTASGLALLWLSARRTWVERGWLVLAVTGAIAVDYHHELPNLRPYPARTFHDFVTYGGNDAYEQSPLRPHVLYQYNRYGLRAPDWAEEHPADTWRVAVIGDSHAFGAGVEEEGTLRASLERDLIARWPERRIQVLNLGIVGTNLGSHVRMLRLARDVLKADAIVLELVVPGDLAPHDIQDLERDIRRVSPLSLSAVLLGEPLAALLFQTTEAQLHMGEENRRFLQQSLADLKRDPTPFPSIYVFCPGGRFGDNVVASVCGQVVDRELQAMPQLVSVPVTQVEKDYFIPNDSHPTAEGNGVFAHAIGDAMARTHPPPLLTASPD